jgi:naphthalene 1,2-dioxygenase system ferredoxin subunit
MGTKDEEPEYLASIDSGALQEGRPCVIEVDGDEVCIVKLGDRYFAFSNICTHIGGRLSKGKILPGNRISCPEHKAVYRMDDGASLYFPRRGLRVYPVSAEGGKVRIGRPYPPRWREPLPSFKPGWWQRPTERQL